ISGALAVVNSFTAPVSAANAAVREDEARRQIIPDAARFEAVENDAFSGNILAAYAGIDETGETEGYVFTVNGTGFGGTVSIICGIGADGKVLKTQALDISGETKTLGGKVVNPEYADQYIGEDESLSGVDAISGATITSNAYKSCVQAAFEAFKLIGEVA
ncbi:MAG: FMN-binding protein, partial [Clostridia bacterium]|nr:FMN-binding protein [Clostridia bacterium]